MKKLCKLIYAFSIKVKSLFNKLFIAPIIKGAFKQCGKSVRVGRGCKFSGIDNISVGNNVVLGENTRILTTKAQVVLGNDVVFGPDVMLVSGDHRIDVLDKHIIYVTDAEKLPENDQDIVIEDDCWIGARVIILKGVTIGKGSVVAAGSVCTKSCEPYSIIGGVPAKVIAKRFTEEEIFIYEKNTQTKN